MELRRQCIQDVQSGATPITELCVAYRISRKTGYKWLTRYEVGGQGPLEARHHHPTWGPRKLLRLLRQREPSAVSPPDCLE